MARQYKPLVTDDEVLAIIRRGKYLSLSELTPASPKGAYREQFGMHHLLAKPARDALHRFSGIDRCGEINAEAFNQVVETIIATPMPHESSFPILHFIALAEHHDLRFKNLEETLKAVKGIHDLIAPGISIGKKSAMRRVFWRRVQAAFVIFGGHQECLPELSDDLCASVFLIAVQLLQGLNDIISGCRVLRAAWTIKKEGIDTDSFVTLLAQHPETRIDDFTALAANHVLTQTSIHLLIKTKHLVEFLDYVSLYQLLRFVGDDADVDLDSIFEELGEDILCEGDEPPEVFVMPDKKSGETNEVTDVKARRTTPIHLELPIPEKAGSRFHVPLMQCILVDVIAEPENEAPSLLSGSKIGKDDFRRLCNEAASRHGYPEELVETTIRSLHSLGILKAHKSSGVTKGGKRITFIRDPSHLIGKEIVTSLFAFRLKVTTI